MSERRFLVVLMLALVVAGCAAPGPRTEQRSMTDPATHAAGRTFSAAPLSSTAWPDESWWRALGDPRLDALIERALAGSPTIAVAGARLSRAVAAALAAQSALQPEAVVNLDVTHQRFSAAGLIPPPVGGSWRSQNRLAVDLAWDLDVWGRNQSIYAAALGQAKAVEIETFATRLALATAIARSYVELDRVHEQADLARATLKQREGVLALVARRVQVGVENGVALRQAEAAVPSARAEIEALEEAIVIARHQLAALTGLGPDHGLEIARPKLSVAAPLRLPSLLPADLMGRRPDVVAQRWRVEAAARDIDAARARFYPNVNLIAFLGLSSVGLGELIGSAAAIAGVGPAVRLPLFEGGRLRADLAGRQADYDVAVEQYNQVIVDALREIADQVVSMRAIVRRRAEQAQVLDRFRRAYDLAVLRYREGAGNFLEVLAAEGQVLAQGRADVDLRARELDLAVGLVRALGGGFDPQAVAAVGAGAARRDASSAPAGSRPVHAPAAEERAHR